MSKIAGMVQCPSCGLYIGRAAVGGHCPECGTALDRAERSRQKCVLLADSSPRSRGKIGTIVKQLGCRIVEAVNGNEALHLATVSKPDLVILEAAMPDDDGIGALHELRHTVRLGDTPVIMLTSKADLQTVSRALQNQVSDYILNNAPTEEIKKRLSQHLGLNDSTAA